MLNFRITQRRTRSTHRQYLKRGVDSYHTTEFRGIAPYFGGLKLREVCKSLKLTETSKCDLMYLLVEYLESTYKEIGDFEFLSRHFLQSTYTVGRAARSIYLKMRYGGDSLKAYQREHPQSEELEDYFRARKLLLGGMCITNPDYKGKLFIRKNPNSIKKYDVNGLYSYIANECGELSPPEPTDEETFYSDSSGEWVYIIVLRGLLGYRKCDKSPVFADPYTHIEDNIIEFNTEYAIFGELFKELDNFYDIEEGWIKRVYRCRKKPDKVMQEYNARLVAFKDKGRSEDNRALYVISKIFLNALIGKFLQATKFLTIEASYNAEEDMVYLEHGKTVNNNWEGKHFDFIRGAYIYTMARVKVMRDLTRVFATCGKKMYYHHWYTDTDSIVTDIDFPKDMLSQTELGKYKLEEEYNYFGVVCKKVYYGRNIKGEDKLIAAGIPKEELIRLIEEAYTSGLTPFQYFDFINNGRELELPTRVRVPGGCDIVMSKHTVNMPLPLEFI